MKCPPNRMWLIYAKKPNSPHSTWCSGIATVRLERVKNAICVGQCLSLDLFKATNYTMQGCESVWGELGQSLSAERGNKELHFFIYFPMHSFIFVTFCCYIFFFSTFCFHYLQFKTSLWEVNSLLLFTTIHQTLSTFYSSWVGKNILEIYSYPLYTPYCNTLSTLMLPQWSIEVISYAKPRPVEV